MPLEDVEQPGAIEAEVAVAAGCRLLEGLPSAGRVEGALRSGSTANSPWLAETLVLPGGELRHDVEIVFDSDPCGNDATILGPVEVDSSFGETFSVGLRGGVDSNERELRYFTLYEHTEASAFGARQAGFGVSVRDDSGRYGASRTLWSADRPNFGTDVVVSGSDIYVYGCQAARFLSADCFMARVLDTEATDLSAYEYYAGSVHWTASVEEAWPIVEGGTDVSVAWLGDIDRYVMAYVTPLGDTVTIRSGLEPFGPWSRPFPLFRCSLPDHDPEAFCSGVQLHPHAPSGDGKMAFSYAISTFDPAARDVDLDGYGTRFVVVGLGELP